jgi:hypothetical protein
MHVKLAAGGPARTPLIAQQSGNADALAVYDNAWRSVRLDNRATPG